MAANLPDWFLPTVAALIPAHIAGDDLQVVPVPGGGNNRTFQVSAGPSRFLAKWYFSAPGDPRDRGRTEWQFTTFAWRNGLEACPEPIAFDPQQRLALFEFISGRKLGAAEIATPHVVAAIDFLLALNQYRWQPDAQSLPPASEACFTFAAHLDCIEQRVRRLRKVANTPGISSAAREFLACRLTPTAEKVATRLRARLQLAGRHELAELSPDERIVSPSDFGFHNALLEPAGRLRFVDFEYAGWDDPAKTVCDFFSQVQIPAPPEAWNRFVTELSAIGGADLPLRAALLRPLYLVKWSCIVLNPLLRTGREQRRFRGEHESDAADLESDRVARAERLLLEIEE